ncbi:hypothetical protein HY990_00055 [Candidatus Micrarchaeota archaeon]|nr:hypothetical protein [Candidatus Micrarchaeota archaeon]
MANFFIAVGGTGQMVAMALWRLRSLMPWVGISPVNMYHMDMDTVSGFTKTVQKSTHIPPIPHGAKVTYGAHFTDPPNQILCNDILNTLFTTQEQNTNISTGMYGHPPVGSAVIADMLNAAGGAKTGLLNGGGTVGGAPFLTDGNEHTLVICGSALGGTGAGGVPSLAQYINTQLVNVGNVARARVKIYILYFLKHFSLPAADGDDDNIRIKNTQITTNSESGICYLKEMIAAGTDGCLLLGMDTAPSRTYQNVGAQTEQSQPLYIIASLYAQKAYVSGKFPAGGIYAHALKTRDDSNLVEDIGIKVSFSDNEQIELDRLIQLNMAVTEGLIRIRRFINPPPEFALVPPIPTKLDNALNQLAVLNNKRKKDTCKELSEYLKQEVGRITQLTDWYKDVLANANATSFTFRKIDRLSDRNYEKEIKRMMKLIRGSANGLDVIYLDKDKSYHQMTEQLSNSLFRVIKEKFFSKKT